MKFFVDQISTRQASVLEMYNRTGSTSCLAKSCHAHHQMALREKYVGQKRGESYLDALLLGERVGNGIVECPVRYLTSPPRPNFSQRWSTSLEQSPPLLLLILGTCFSCQDRASPKVYDSTCTQGCANTQSDVWQTLRSAAHLRKWQNYCHRRSLTGWQKSIRK